MTTMTALELVEKSVTVFERKEIHAETPVWLEISLPGDFKESGHYDANGRVTVLAEMTAVITRTDGCGRSLILQGRH